MQANDARLIRGAALPTAAAGVIAVITSALVSGLEGAIGAVIAPVIVVIFFSISQLVVSWASRISPQTMMLAALVSYVLKVLAVLGFVIALGNATFLDTKAFAWSVVACTLVWIAAEVRLMKRMRVFYVEPGTAPPGVPAKTGGRRSDESP